MLIEFPISIGWISIDNTHWCKANSIISAPLNQIQEILEDKKNYPNIFKRIEKITIISEDIVHIILDLPFPFYGRDYIIKYTEFQKNYDIIYEFNPVKDSGIPIYKDYVRLINASGQWRLNPIDNNKTEIIYIWNGELLGDFPDWALTTAWETQGKEVIAWIKEATK